MACCGLVDVAWAASAPAAWAGACSGHAIWHPSSPIRVAPSQERCTYGSTGRKNDERRRVWPEMTSSEEEREGKEEIGERYGEGREKVERKVKRKRENSRMLVSGFKTRLYTLLDFTKRSFVFCGF